MEDSFLYSHIANGTWFEIKCCYCDTDAPIYLTHSKRHGTPKDYKPKSRLKFVTDFIKNHYKDIQYKLDQEKQYGRRWKQPDDPFETPDCALLREMNHFEKTFKLVDEDGNEYAFHPHDLEYLHQLKQITLWLKKQENFLNI